MKPLKNQKENKAGILDDMLDFITCTLNRESDILAFMEQYQKAEPERRAGILEQLHACMYSKKYPNPYAGAITIPRRMWLTAVKSLMIISALPMPSGMPRLSPNVCESQSAKSTS
ncbi:MAG: hypothetical protein RSF89_05320 [Oscillospiraceae bacterium]